MTAKASIAAFVLTCGCSSTETSNPLRSPHPVYSRERGKRRSKHDLCKRVLSCDPLYPLVVCTLRGDGRGDHSGVVNPGLSTFVKLLSSSPLLTE